MTTVHSSLNDSQLTAGLMKMLLIKVGWEAYYIAEDPRIKLSRLYSTLES